MLRLISWLASILALFAAAAMQLLTPSLHIDLRNAVFDTYQVLKPREVANNRVKIIDINDESLARIGQWPWPRDVMAELVTKLTAQGAASVTFDVAFPESDRAAPRRYLQKWQNNPEIARLILRLPDTDAVFAEALKQSPSVTGFSLNIGEPSTRLPAKRAGVVVQGSDPSAFLHRFDKAVTSIPEIETAAAGNGSFNFIPDGDGVIRRVPLVLKFGGEFYPTLALEALRVAQGDRNIIIVTDAQAGDTEANGITHVRVGKRSIPTDRQGQVWVHYTPSLQERVIPAWMVLNDALPENALDDAIVFIGPSSEGLKDLRFSPLGPLPGVEVHAQLVEQILDGTYLQRPYWAGHFEFLLIVAVWLIVVPAAFRLGAAWAAVAVAAVVVGVLAMSWLLFSEANYLVNPNMPVLAAIAIYVGAAVPRFVDSERQRRWISGAFSSYISPNLVEHLIENPGELSLGGERRECSFVLTDLAGFTGLVEQSDPATIAALLNDYLEGMVEIAFQNDGTLDRIVGDAVAVMFSAPIEQADHAARAVRCALEMNRFASEFARTRGTADKPLGPTRIGVNTGTVTVGNFGGGAMFDYRALGDPINTAARLESANRYLGTQVCVAGTTVARCADFVGRPIGDLWLVGKSEGIAAFEPLDEDSFRSERIQAYMQAYQRLASGDAGVVAEFEALHERFPDDGVIAFHLDRLRDGETGTQIRFEQK